MVYIIIRTHSYSLCKEQRCISERHIIYVSSDPKSAYKLYEELKGKERNEKYAYEIEMKNKYQYDPNTAYGMIDERGSYSYRVIQIESEKFYENGMNI